MPQIRVHLDYETFSEADIKKVGHIAYAKHHSTEVLMASWCFKAGGANQWTIEDGDIPSELRDILENRNGKYECWAHNASFEMAITIYAAARQFGLKLPRFRKWIQNWHCSMVAGMSMSLPGTLKEQGEVLGSDIRKQADGMRLINLFCKPRKATKKSDAKRNWPWSKPIEWDQFCSYNRDDALAERANWRRISAFPMPAHEWDLWRLDQVINFRGLPIDEDLVDAALDVNAQVQELLKKEMKKVTKLANPNSPTQLLAWLNERGYPFDNLRKATVEKTLKDFNAGESSDADIDEIVARVLDLRLLTSRTSIRKYNALKAGTVEGRMFGVFQFCGAGRTWRWAGRRFQPQNLPRGIFKTAEQMATAIAAVKRRDIEYLATMYDLENIPDVLASLIRCAIRAKAGKVMTVADLSSIESVMLAWAANSEYMLDLFRNGLDIYKDFATHWLKVPYNEVTKAMRQLCKPPSLGCFAADTKVLTKRGYVHIVSILDSDELWDGVEWVRHSGVAFQGMKSVLTKYGVTATPDHHILTKDGWLPWSELTDSSTPQAKQLATGNFWNSVASTGFADANVEGSSGYRPEILIKGRRAGVSFAQTSVLQQSAQRLQELGYHNTITTDSLAESMLSGAAALTETMETMVAAAFSSGSALWKMPSGTMSPLTDGTTLPEKSTVLTMTDIMNPAMFDSYPASSTPITNGPAAISHTKVPPTRTSSSGANTHQSTETREPSAEKQLLDLALSVLSRNKASAKVPTFDILNAGPRSRFTILTDEGPVLAHNCGYLLGAKGLIAYADGMGVKLDKKEAKAAVQTYRTAYPDVPRLWKDLDMAARKCIATGETVWVNGKFRFRMQKPCMMIDLPSGRSLCYVRPKIERRSFRWEDDDTGEIKELFRNAIVYEGRNQKTGRWERIATHAGKITENIVQAIARDILSQGLTDADADLPELEVCLHVHDEIGGESPDEPWVLDSLQEIMARKPSWGPDIPLGSAGFQNVFYRKD